MKRVLQLWICSMGCVVLLGCGVNEPVPRRVVQPENSKSKVPPAGGLVGYRVALAQTSKFLFPEPTLEQTTVEALSRIGRPAVSELAAALKDPNPLLRKQAARALAKMGSSAREAVPELIAAIDDPDEGVRRNAVRALGEIGPPAAPAVPELMKQLRASTAEEDITPAQPATMP